MTILPKRVLEAILKKIRLYEIFHNYRKVRLKMLTCMKRTQFLSKCLNNNLIPNFLRFKIPSNGVFNEKAVFKFQRELLKSELSKAHNDLKYLKQECSKTRLKIQNDIPEVLWSSILFTIHQETVFMNFRLEENHRSKINGLAEKQDKPLKNTFNNVKLLDPNIKLPEYAAKVLAMGPKHPVIDKYTIKDTLAEVDSLLEYLEPKIIVNDEGVDITTQTQNLIEFEANKYNQCMSKKKINTDYMKTNKFLKQNGLKAVPCDKSNGFMVMSDQAYNERISKVLRGKEFKKYAKPRKML